jgi:glycosyltransferase involved in cell wall biosynthesis
VDLTNVLFVIPTEATRLRLLIHSRFHPSVGGIETVASLLANEWTRTGESVTVVTDVRNDPATKAKFAFPVRHRPRASEWLHLLRTHDALIHFNISLRALWPLLLIRRPFVAVHHGFYIVDRSGRRDWRENLKLWIAKRATKNIAVSGAVAREIGIPCVVISNPYDPFSFVTEPGRARSRELIFVGRLVSDKGVDILLKALAMVRERGLHPVLTIVGDGPEREPLEKLVLELRLKEQVTFSGTQSQREVADLLRQHAILVVPSVIDEGFGIVALEGIAAGCAVIGSNGGGLPEAIGPCGVTFPNGDAVALAEKIQELLTNRATLTELLANAREHLEKHHPTRVGEQYMTVIREALCRN